VDDAAWSPDSMMLAIASGVYDTGGIVDIQDAGGNPILTIEVPDYKHENFVDPIFPSTLEWSPGGTLLAMGGTNRTVMVWRVDSWEALLTYHEPTWGPIQNLAFNPSGTMLAGTTGIPGGDAPDWDQRVFVWDMNTAETRTLNGHSQPPVTLAWSPDGSMLATGTNYFNDAGELILWDVNEGTAANVLSQGQGLPFNAVMWLPDGVTLLVAGGKYMEGQMGPLSGSWVETGDLIGWNVVNNSITMSNSDPGLVGVIQEFILSPDGKVVATWTSDDVSLWDTRTGTLLQRLQATEWLAAKRWPDDGALEALAPGLNTTGAVYTLAASSDGTEFAAAYFQGLLGVYDAVTGEEVFVVECSPGIQELEWGPDGKQLVTVDDRLDGAEITLWDAESGTRIEEFGVSGSHPQVAFSPDGMRLLVAGDTDAGNVAAIYSVQTAERLIDLTGIHGSIQSAAWSPDGSTIAIGSDGRRRNNTNGTNLMLWDAETGQPLYQLTGHDEAVTVIAWSRDGTRFATAGGMIPGMGSPFVEGWQVNRINVWDSATGVLLYSLAGHNGRVIDLKWSPDGKRLASGSVDRTVLIWDVP
jgi:WD40 repeat protein